MSDVTINDNSGEVVVTQPIHEMTLAELKEYIVIDNGTDIKTVTVEDTNTIGIIDTVTEVVETRNESVTITEIGIQGPAGVSPVGADLHYQTDFAPTSSLTITHNLHKLPAVTVIDSAGTEVIGDIAHINNDQLTVTFGASFGGKVICN